MIKYLDKEWSDESFLEFCKAVQKHYLDQFPYGWAKDLPHDEYEKLAHIERHLRLPLLGTAWRTHMATKKQGKEVSCKQLTLTL